MRGPTIPAAAGAGTSVGIIFVGTPAFGAPALDALRDGLRDLVYVEGEAIALEPRYAEGRVEWQPETAAELVRFGVSAFVAHEPSGFRAAGRPATDV